jgi:hypothetical protein
MRDKQKNPTPPPGERPAERAAPLLNRRRALTLLGLTGAGGLVYLFGFGLLASVPARSAEVEVFKSPSCGCCGKWVRHVERAGFAVKVRQSEDLDPIKARAGIPDRLISCHTAFVEGYVIEGHVPAPSLHKLLAEKPAIRGLAVPGMPLGSPGMEGAGREPYEVLSFRRNGAVAIYARYR